MKLNTYFSLLIVSVFIWSCGSDKSYNEQIKEYNFYVNKADSLIKTENFLESCKYSNTAIGITDTLSKAFYTKGVAVFNLNSLDIALENFDEVIDIEGEGSIAYKNRALVHLKNKDSDFLEDIDNYLKFHSEDEEAQLLKRQYFEDKEDYGNAITEYNKTIKKYSDSTDLYVKRSNLLYLNGDFNEALKDYDKILELSPNNVKALSKKSALLKEINKKDNVLIFMGLLVFIYVVYILLSFFVFKPLVLKKATNQIGGEFTVLKDPLIWVLPVLLTVVFVAVYFIDTIPNFK